MAEEIKKIQENIDKKINEIENDNVEENLNNERINKLQILQENYKEILDISKQSYWLNYIYDNIDILLKKMLMFFDKKWTDIYKEFKENISWFISEDDFLEKNSILKPNWQINENKYKLSANTILFWDNNDEIKKYVKFLPFFLTSRQLHNPTNWDNKTIKWIEYLYNFIKLYNQTINPLNNQDVIKKQYKIIAKEVYGAWMWYYIVLSNEEEFLWKSVKSIINELANKWTYFEIEKGKRLYLLNEAPSGSQITNNTINVYTGFYYILQNFSRIFLYDWYNKYSKIAVLPAYRPIKLFFFCLWLKYIIYSKNMWYENIKEIIDENIINNLFSLNDISWIKELYDTDIIPAFFKLKINKEFKNNNYTITEQDNRFLSLLNASI